MRDTASAGIVSNLYGGHLFWNTRQSMVINPTAVLYNLVSTLHLDLMRDTDE